MENKKILKTVLTIGWLAAVAAYGADSKPNVLFIICDDLNTHVSTSDYQHISTPAFDTLADSGMTFRRTHMNG